MRATSLAVAAVVASPFLGGYAAVAGCPEIAADLTLKAATATPTTRGQFSDVEVVLENGGSQRLVILGLAAPDYGPATLVAPIGGTTRPIGSIGLDPVDDRADGRATLHFRLGPALRDLAPGSVMGVHLLTLRGPIPLQIKVPGGTVATAHPGT